MKIKKVLFGLAACSLIGASIQPSSADAANYSDVSYKYWAYEDIKFLSSHKVISGYSDGKFKPGETIKRKDAAVMLMRVIEPVEQVIEDIETTKSTKETNPETKPVPGIPEKPVDPDGISDMTESSPGFKAVKPVVDAGLLSLTEEGAFMPDAPLTRNEMAKALSAAFAFKGTESTSFTDIPANDPYYKAVDAIAYRNITTGYKDGTFRPLENVTRAQFSAFLSRVFQQPLSYEVRSSGNVMETVSTIEEAFERAAQYTNGTIHPTSNKYKQFSQEIASADKTGIKSGVLMYNGMERKTAFTPAFFHHYLSYASPDGREMDMFDTFIVLGRTYDGGELVESPKNDANYADWQAYMDRTFSETGVLQNLNEAAKQKNQHVNVYISIPYPKWNGAFVTMDGREVANDVYARYDIVNWYMSQVEKKWKEFGFTNITFKGYYWMNETVRVQDDGLLLSTISHKIHQKDKFLIYAPHATSTNFQHWKSYGFDAAFLQPNAFRTSVSNKEERLHKAFVNAQMYGTGITIEIDSYGITQAAEGAETFTMYMDFAKRYGLDEKAMIFYQGTNMVERMVTYDSPIFKKWHEELTSTFFSK
ncbi:hypothetical protein BTO30_01435 [Domibacillus antri]|uniref:SLH domain-containing protein n=1 Tax=Domibacillus antri TaxID=1714264 RepID=A0A1Q8Q9T2_9BACI|nr:DUF4855 domain-containing protein [Domibacillus antri]OLN24104.1 hypothetical protein BTO30_01435 [Domibacillus antri]